MERVTGRGWRNGGGADNLNNKNQRYREKGVHIWDYYCYYYYYYSIGERMSDGEDGQQIDEMEREKVKVKNTIT